MSQESHLNNQWPFTPKLSKEARMLIGIPKEIKTTKIGSAPAGVQSLVKKGHHVLVETNAGLGSGFADEDYTKARGSHRLRLLQKAGR